MVDDPLALPPPPPGSPTEMEEFEYFVQPTGEVEVRSSLTGEVLSLPEKEALNLIEQGGYDPLTPGEEFEARAAEAQRRREELPGAAATGAAGFVSGVTGGLSDVYASMSPIQAAVEESRLEKAQAAAAAAKAGKLTEGGLERLEEAREFLADKEGLEGEALERRVEDVRRAMLEAQDPEKLAADVSGAEAAIAMREQRDVGIRGRLAAAREESPIAALGGEVAGMLTPIGPAALAGRTAERVGIEVVKRIAAGKASPIAQRIASQAARGSLGTARRTAARVATVEASKAFAQGASRGVATRIGVQQGTAAGTQAAARAGARAGQVAQQRIAKKIAETGTAKIANFIGKEAAIGAAIGAGASVRNQTLGGESFSFERLVQDAGTGALIGPMFGAIGAVAGAGFGKVATKATGWAGKKILEKVGTTPQSWGRMNYELRFADNSLKSIGQTAAAHSVKASDKWKEVLGRWQSSAGRSAKTRIDDLEQDIGEFSEAFLGRTVSQANKRALRSNLRDAFRLQHEAANRVGVIRRRVAGESLASSLIQRMLPSIVFGGGGYVLTDSPYGLLFAAVPWAVSRAALNLMKPGARDVTRLHSAMSATYEAFHGQKGQLMRRMLKSGATYAQIRQYSTEETENALVELENFDAEQWESDVSTAAMEKGYSVPMAESIGAFQRRVIETMRDSAKKGSSEFSRTMHLFGNPSGFIARLAKGDVSSADIEALKRVDPQSAHMLEIWARDMLESGERGSMPVKVRRMLEMLAGVRSTHSATIQKAAYGGRKQQQRKVSGLEAEPSPTQMQGVQQGPGGNRAITRRM